MPRLSTVPVSLCLGAPRLEHMHMYEADIYAQYEWDIYARDEGTLNDGPLMNGLLL
jgi:hypothetical protein